MDTVLAHAQACVDTAMQMRPLFDSKPQTTEKLAAHALFLRCIDHFRAVVTLGPQGLDVEALSLTRGISEALFVIGALLKGFLTTEQLEGFDLAQKAKNAREMSDFLKRGFEAANGVIIQSFRRDAELRRHAPPYAIFHKQGAVNLRNVWTGASRAWHRHINRVFPNL